MLFAATETLEVGPIIMGVLGGLALFLFGMDQMADSLKLVAGDGMKKVLAKLTTNRFTGLFAGAFVTAIIQSSSVTTVLVVGFISAGLMSLTQSIGVILGADIGTTITAQIVAFKVTKYALILITVGFAMLFCLKNEKIKHYGHMIMGLGLIFFGMQLMSDATHPLRDYQPFRDLMAQMGNPLYGIVIAAVFTAIVQSSSATMGVVIALASQGLISLEAGIALAFGANIGTCVTALLASIGKPREAVRAGAIHILFKVVGVIIWFPFIGYLADLVVTVSPAHADLAGADRLAADTPRQIANAHTIFNVANAAVFIWFTVPLAWLMYRLVPEKVEAEDETAWPEYLDKLLLKTPALALDVVRMELGRLGANALLMVQGALSTVVEGTSAELDSLEHMDNDVDALHAGLVTYLGNLSQENLSQHQSELLHDYLAAANYFENIGDIIETNLVASGRERLVHNVKISTATQQILASFHDKVCWSVERSVKALVAEDRDMAEEVLAAKSEISQLASAADEHLSRRLSADEPNRLAAFKLESEIIEYLKRMYYFAKRIAKIVNEGDGKSPKKDHQPAPQEEPPAV
jgi:phosphate:Na+ symporter